MRGLRIGVIDTPGVKKPRIKVIFFRVVGFQRPGFQDSEPSFRLNMRLDDPVGVTRVANVGPLSFDELNHFNEEDVDNRVRKLVNRKKIESLNFDFEMKKDPVSDWELLQSWNFNTKKYCGGFVHRVKLFFKNGDEPKSFIEISFKKINYGMHAEDRFPLFPLFSHDYQYGPLMSLVFSYLPTSELISTMLLSKYIHDHILEHIPISTIEVRGEVSWKGLCAIISKFEHVEDITVWNFSPPPCASPAPLPSVQEVTDDDVPTEPPEPEQEGATTKLRKVKRLEICKVKGGGSLTFDEIIRVINLSTDVEVLEIGVRVDAAVVDPAAPSITSSDGEEREEEVVVEAEPAEDVNQQANNVLPLLPPGNPAPEPAVPVQPEKEYWTEVLLENLKLHRMYLYENVKAEAWPLFFDLLLQKCALDIVIARDMRLQTFRNRTTVAIQRYQFAHFHRYNKLPQIPQDLSSEEAMRFRANFLGRLCKKFVESDEKRLAECTPIRSGTIPLRFTAEQDVLDIFMSGFLFRAHYAHRRNFKNDDGVALFSLNLLYNPKVSGRVSGIVQHENEQRYVQISMCPRVWNFAEPHFFENYARIDFEKVPDCRMNLALEIHDILTARMARSALLMQEELLLTGKRDHSFEFPKISLDDFDCTFEGMRSKICECVLNGIRWNVHLRYNPESLLWDIYFGAYYPKYVFFADVSFKVNDISKGFMKNRFMEGLRTGWTHQYLDTVENLQKSGISISIVTHISRVLRKQEYDAEREREKREMIEKVSRMEISKPMVDSVELKFHVPTFINSRSLEFDMFDLRWKMQFNRSWGKFGRSSLYVTNVFKGKFIVQASYSLEMKGGRLVCESPPISYYAGRGWGFDEISIDNSEIVNDTFEFKLTIRLLRIVNKQEYQEECNKLLSAWRPGDKHSATFAFNSKGAVNSMQSTELSEINGIPFFAEIFPAGMDSLDQVSIFLYHQIFHLAVCANYTLSTEYGGKVIKKTLREDSSTLKFPGFVPVDPSVNWKFTLEMELLEIRK